MDRKEFLAPYTPAVQLLALKTCELVRSKIPEVIEQIDPPDHLIGYGYDLTYKGMICSLAPYKTYVNLIFSRVTALPYPDRLLEGTGKLARHVKMKTMEDVTNPSVRWLLLQAAVITKENMERIIKK